MDCTACGHPNRRGAAYCEACGAPVERRCPRCGSEHRAGAQFCDACGQPLEAGRSPRSYVPEHLVDKIRAGQRRLAGERKQVTVLFADVTGSMALAESVDPEAWQRIMDRFFALLCEGVHRFEGTVDKFTGDGIMALFGAPIAHEDHARRACYAALHLRDELARHAADLRREHGLNFAVRMGLNSGEVVVGTIGPELQLDYTAIGHTVGLAQRMEQLAEPGKVYLTQHTASLVEGYLALSDLGEFGIRGASRPLRVHELTGVGAARGALDVARARGFSRFVGRDEELRALESALEQAFAGRGQVIGIVGEAGVGKSRLCHEFAARRRAQGVPVFHVAGQAHARSVPLLPVLQFLRAYFEIGERDSDRTARERIAGKLLLLDPSFDEDLPLIFDFLAVPDPQRPATQMDPEARQRRLLGLMKHLTRAESAREPGVTVIEDLHWLDPASEAFLANHVEGIQGTRGLTVLNFRPEYRAPWMAHSYYRQIALAPLAPAAVDEMLADLLGPDPSLGGLAELIRERTQGNPFFIEELVRGLVEARNLEGERGAYRVAAPVTDAAVPASVHAVLAARIDRLTSREKRVLQAAAVVGKEFSQPVLQRVVGLPPAALQDSLGKLVMGEFVYEQELYPEPIYAFKHPLTQEVAYGSQLAERRAPVHASAARAIAEHYPERLDERAALLAQHWEAAGERLQAARWHARAGAWSGTSDMPGALRHWDRVRALADALPASAETAALGLTARIFSLQFGWRLGSSRDEAEALFRDAERMAAATGDHRSRGLVLSAYGALRGSSDGDVREFATLTRRANALAEESGDVVLYLANAPVGYALLCVGEYREALAILDRAIELADGDATVGAGLTPLSCPLALCHSLKGFVLAHLGELKEARQPLDRGMNLAREHGDIATVGWSRMWLHVLAYAAGEPEPALAHARAALEIAERIGDWYSRAWAWTILGQAEQMRGEWRAAIEAIERSLAIARDRRAAVEGTSFRLAILAESYLGLGDLKRARALAERGVEIARERGIVAAEMQATRTLASVLLASAGLDARPEIEAALSRGLELARRTEAKATVPHVHVQLAELARQAGDETGRERELRQAHRLFTEVGATGHAERLAAELATPAK